MKATGSKKAQATSRGKTIASHRKQTGDSTDWKTIFKKLDASKKGKRR